MKRKLYRIYLKVVELGKKNPLTGQRVVESPIEEYMPYLRKQFPDASSIYVELLEEFEREEPEESADTESIIILG